MAAAISPNPKLGKTSSVSQRLEVGSLVAERYQVLELRGEGRAGAVYVAEHTLLKKKVAVKVLHAELTDTKSGVARFEREATAMARIDHPNVATALDYGTLPSGQHYIILEYVDGLSLRHAIEQGPLPPERVIHIARQIGEALVASHARDIVHRDLKPENIMLVQRQDEADFVKVLDFGVARVAGDAETAEQALTKAGAVFGTPEYIPAEQGMGQRVDGRADLYSLGVLMFEMLVGVRPYAARPEMGILAQQLTLPVPTFEERSGLTVDPNLARLVYRLLAKHPQDRVQTASDLLVALDRVRAGAEPFAVPVDAGVGQGEPLPAFSLNTLLQIPPASVNPGVDNGQKGQFAPTAAATAAAAHPVSAAAAEHGKSVSPLASVKHTSQAAWGATRGGFGALVTWVEHRRHRLPKPLRTWSQRVPTAVLTVAAVVLILAACAAAAVALRHAFSNKAVASNGATQAHPQQSAAAALGAGPPLAQGGAAALANADDGATLVASAEAKLRDSRDTEAIKLLVQALGKHPDLRNDLRVAHMLFQLARSNAKNVANTTFSLLEGTMAGRGAEVVYQLAVDRSQPNYVSARAEKWLHTPQFERAASDALRVAVALRFAKTCEAKRAILPMAAKSGAAAALAYLNELKTETGCGLSGKDDCYACLRKDNALGETITQIENRLKQ